MCVLLAACGSGSAPKADPVPTTSPTTTTTTTVPPTTTAPPATTSTTTTVAPPRSTTTTGPAPPYEYSVAEVTAADLGASWHEGCPVDPSDLRMLTLTFINFDDQEQSGQVVVNAAVVDQVVRAFRQIYAARFPIRKMKPIFTQQEYDDFETPDDNSTGYSCRDAVNSDGPKSWSQHAYGKAIDINPIENPYDDNGRIIPSRGAEYMDRDNVRPGMATPNSALVRAFQSVGWGWGASFEDYQHFSTNGR